MPHDSSPPAAAPPGPPSRPYNLRLRMRLAAVFGVTPEASVTVVQRMLEGHGRNAPLYWMQLLLAMGIATLGLALGSTAVVIGAMLVSPLMGPIVELGMGLAVGSPLLTGWSLTRTALSTVAVIGSAAALTLALPFHEVTPEIAARTSPTALDLLIAVFCALAAALSTLRSPSDTATTAAGTAIAIALVPPLCVVGFGLGTQQWAIAGGAAMLFVANFCAIVLFAVITFLVFAFDAVAVGQLEASYLKGDRPAGRAARWAHAAFRSRFSPLLKVLMPVVLLAAVYVPLRGALAEVTWEVRVRAEVQRIFGQMPLAEGAVRSSVSVERGAVRVRLVIVSTPEQAVDLQRELSTRVAAAAGVVPTVEVVAVPDMVALEQAMAPVARQALEPIRVADLGETARALSEALSRAWPVEAAGQLVGSRVDVTDPARPVVEVAHLGPPLGTAGEALLARALSDRLGGAVSIRDVALRAEPVTAAIGDGASWFAALARALDAADRFEGIYACVEMPAAAPPVADAGARDAGADTPEDATGWSDASALRVVALSEIARTRAGKARGTLGTRWSVRLQAEPCAQVVPVSAGDADMDAGAR